jgi:predicted phosphodiesterase
MRRRFPDADAVLFGHSHLPLHERADDADPRSFQIFNPGSPTERRRAPRHSMGVAELTPEGALELRHVWLD